MTATERAAHESGDKNEKITLSMEKRAEVQPFIPGEPAAAPIDKGSLVYLIIFLHGIGTLMPWNMFLTIAQTYYVDYKMKENVNGTMTPTWYSDNYMVLQNVCSQTPNLLLNLINIFIVVKGDLTKRIGLSLCVVGAAVLFTMSFIYANTWAWQGGFFALTLLTVVVLNGTNGIYQNSIFGLVSDFPFKYTNAVIIGNNFCGTFVSIISIIAIAFFDSIELVAMVYFGISLLTIAACFASFFSLKKLPFYRHYAKCDEKKYAVEGGEVEEEEAGVTPMDFIATFKEGWVGFTNVFLIFFVTLTIFPGMMFGVVPDTENAVWTFFGPKLYHSFTIFLLFNLLAFVGSLLGSWKQVIAPEHMRIWVYLRVLLIPAFTLLNYRPATRGVLPILTTSNWAFLFLGAVMSISSGYLSSLGMMYITRYVSPARARTAMMMAAFFLISGIVAGILFAPAVGAIVDLF